MVSSRPGRTRQVDAAEEFTAWLRDLESETQERVVALRRLLERHGPTLGRPYADRIEGSKRHNLKELRPTSRKDEVLRILFYFDPRRQAILLVGGNKAGDWHGWYDRNILIAEERIARHEAALARQAETLAKATRQQKPGTPGRPARRKRCAISTSCVPRSRHAREPRPESPPRSSG